MGVTGKRLASFVLAGSVAALAAALPVDAHAGSAPALKVTSAEKTGSCTGSTQAYLIHTQLRVANHGKTRAEVASVRFAVAGTATGKPHAFTAHARATHGIGGSAIAARSARTFLVDVRTRVPCKTVNASVCTTVKLRPHGSLHACARFVKRGQVVVPVGTIGLLALTFVLGLALTVAQRVTGRRKRVRLRA